MMGYKGEEGGICFYILLICWGSLIRKTRFSCIQHKENADLIICSDGRMTQRGLHRRRRYVVEDKTQEEEHNDDRTKE